jgi:hypothetical protein
VAVYVATVPYTQELHLSTFVFNFLLEQCGIRHVPVNLT